MRRRGVWDDRPDLAPVLEPPTHEVDWGLVRWLVAWWLVVAGGYSGAVLVAGRRAGAIPVLWVVFGFLAALIYVAWARSSGASGERPNGAGGPGEAGSRILAGVLAWPLVAAVLSLAPGRSFGTALWSASVLLVGIGTLSYVTHGEPPRLDSPGGATRFLRDRRHR